MKLRTLFAVLAVTLIGAAAHSAPTAKLPRYTFIDLSAITGRQLGCATAINNKGQIVFGSLVWTPGKSISEPGSWLKLGHGMDVGDGEFPPFTDARDINDKGQVVGRTGISVTQPDGSKPQCPFRTEPNRPLQKEAILETNADCCYALAINSQGIAVGYGHNIHAAPANAIVWHIDGSPHILPKPDYHDDCSASDINDSGVIVGDYGRDLRTDHAVLWKNNKLREMGVGKANAINERGCVVGSSQDQACKWLNNKRTLLGRLGFPKSEAVDINNSDIIIGWYGNPDRRTERACLWANGQAYDLNKLTDVPKGWVLKYANSINDKGQIVGDCYSARERKWKAVLLIPQEADTPTP